MYLYILKVGVHVFTSCILCEYVGMHVCVYSMQLWTC